jgi:hypothetical protein
LVIVVFICHIKNKSNDDSDESSTSSPIPVQRERRHRHPRPQRSHYAGAFRSPPPPYTTNELPRNLFVTPSLPPPYESHINENVSTNPQNTFYVQPIENPITIRPVDLSSTITSPSMQTFQA